MSFRQNVPSTKHTSTKHSGTRRPFVQVTKCLSLLDVPRRQHAVCTTVMYHRGRINTKYCKPLYNKKNRWGCDWGTFYFGIGASKVGAKHGGYSGYTFDVYTFTHYLKHLISQPNKQLGYLVVGGLVFFSSVWFVRLMDGRFRGQDVWLMGC
jgi:hypothetical protein